MKETIKSINQLIYILQEYFPCPSSNPNPSHLHPWFAPPSKRLLEIFVLILIQNFRDVVWIFFFMAFIVYAYYCNWWLKREETKLVCQLYIPLTCEFLQLLFFFIIFFMLTLLDQEIWHYFFLYPIIETSGRLLSVHVHFFSCFLSRVFTQTFLFYFSWHEMFPNKSSA